MERLVFDRLLSGEDSGQIFIFNTDGTCSFLSEYLSLCDDHPNRLAMVDDLIDCEEHLACDSKP